MKKIIKNLTKAEKIAVALLGLVMLATGFQICHKFYIEHSDISAVEGGVYIEGAVGKIGLLNPLFVHQGSITHDITQLIYSGLTRYNPETREIIGDLADFKKSSNGKEYTFVLKEGVKWHDGEPVTSDDVLFTYNTIIKSPGFSGAVLNYNDYTGIKIVRIDDRTLQFLLEKPDSFFLVKTTIGLLPRHILENEPIEFLEGSPFNYSPIGAGRYKYTSTATLSDHTEVSLEVFDDYYDRSGIKNIIIKAYFNFDDLLKKQGEFNGIRNIPEQYTEKLLKKGLFNINQYHLPQYVAIFINTESPKLKNKTVRLALQLGTDKTSLIENINQHQIIDTPILEIDQSNWRLQHSIKKANGALFDTEWKIPEPIVEPIVEPVVEPVVEPIVDTIVEPDFINSPNAGDDYRTTQNKVTITGTVPKKTKSVFINDYELKKYIPGDPGWSYVASTEFENLEKGKNIYDVHVIDFNAKKSLIDSIIITYGDEEMFLEEDKIIREEENKTFSNLPIRVNSKSETLTLNLITSQTPEIYQNVAQIIKGQWGRIGVDVNIEVLKNGDFQQRLAKRDYDLLIFGQNLGYNLDAYPYWHSSQAKEDGYNLSQFKNFVVDSLLEKVRLEYTKEDRLETLSKIQEVISEEVPAVFLYSPTYYFALSDKIQNASFKNLATISDRFARIENWSAKIDRHWKKGTTPFTFVGWIIGQF